MLVLGLTGSIGMGKSTTARFFAEEGVPVLDADAVVHALYDGEAVAAIEAAFPGTSKDGRIDREELSRRVVGDPAALKRLESIVHPLVRAAQSSFPGRRGAIRRAGRSSRRPTAIRDRRRSARRCGRCGFGAGGCATRPHASIARE